ncbi:hypothetical protein C8R46DRAFT_346577 [Mycena filopes]|nr:hypothetical protein C8R46DRAFT_346577 [Mycena filopes]
MRSTKSWCLAVTRHSHLAERVHALSLQLPESTGLSPADGTKIYGALMRCVNLKQLKVVFEKTSTNSGPNSIHGWLINDCPFRLTQFTNSYFHFGWIEEFWEAQSEIRVLSAPDSSALALKTLGDWLPNLIAVKTAYVQALPDGRPLERIEAGFAHRRDFSPLAQYSRTLTTLNLVRQWFDRDASFFDAITAIAELLPALVNFGITEVDRQRYPVTEPSCGRIFHRFSRLETFVFLVRNRVYHS